MCVRTFNTWSIWIWKEAHLGYMYALIFALQTYSSQGRVMLMLHAVWKLFLTLWYPHPSIGQRVTVRRRIPTRSRIRTNSKSHGPGFDGVSGLHNPCQLPNSTTPTKANIFHTLLWLELEILTALSLNSIVLQGACAESCDRTNQLWCATRISC